MENNYEIDELIIDSGKRLLDISDSEDRVRESEVYANLCKAKADLNKQADDKDDKKWIEYVKLGCEIGVVVASLATAGSKYYEVGARRKSNKEAMFIEETMGRFIPPKWFNNK